MASLPPDAWQTVSRITIVVIGTRDNHESNPDPISHDKPISTKGNDSEPHRNGFIDSRIHASSSNGPPVRRREELGAAAETVHPRVCADHSRKGQFPEAVQDG